MSDWTPERLKKLRTAFGESQSQFCKRLRLSPDTIQYWEQGRGVPSGPVTLLLEQLEAEAAEREASSRVAASNGHTKPRRKVAV